MSAPASNLIRLTILAISISSIGAFTATSLTHENYHVSRTILASNTPLNEPEDAKPQLDINDDSVTPQKKVTKKRVAGHKDGVFSPVVVAAKKVLGDNGLKKVRANVIGYHSKSIKKFVDTYESDFGQKVCEQAFKLMDTNNDGVIDDEELMRGLHALGFTWMDEKQIKGIVRKADKNDDGVLELNEFTPQVAKVLKTNLIKLAKQNGDDMGLLI